MRVNNIKWKLNHPIVPKSYYMLREIPSLAEKGNNMKGHVVKWIEWKSDNYVKERWHLITICVTKVPGVTGEWPLQGYRANSVVKWLCFLWWVTSRLAAYSWRRPKQLPFAVMRDFNNSAWSVFTFLFSFFGFPFLAKLIVKLSWTINDKVDNPSFKRYGRMLLKISNYFFEFPQSDLCF